MNREAKRIAIVGLGLIGGSLALRLREKHLASELIGVDTNPGHASQALGMGLVDRTAILKEAVEQADVIILAVPVDGILHLLPQVLNQVRHQVVIDMGSTKNAALQLIKAHPARGRYVATHPMWGNEYSGPAAARTDSFAGRVAVLCNESESDADAVRWVRMMYSCMGMRLVSMEGAEHDRHVAYVSHVSHVISFALANAVLEKEKEEQSIFDLASGGFESTVRLAKSSPSMWVPILLENKGPILDVLQEYKKKLDELEQSIRKEDPSELGNLLAEANRIRKIIA